jgi:digeranylgeranylglycerophospholipid reductase
MIAVDRERCTYCGGCVNVCPVEALTLAETRLVVSKGCIDYGKCLAACPVGALSARPAERAQPQPPLRRRYDLVVVGAGPGGATAAQVAAQAGLSVLLLEKRQEIGSPVRCAEGVGHEQLLPFIEADPRWVAAEVNQAEITTVAGGKAKTQRAGGGRGYVLERHVFDRVLAERAAQAGAEVRVKTAATGLLMEDEGEATLPSPGSVRGERRRREAHVTGVRIRRGDFFTGGEEVEVEVEAPVVIAADGVEAQVGRWAGLEVHLALKDTMVCAQYLLAGIDVDPTCTCYTIGHEVAPGGYAWIFPKGEGKANVGLGVQADLWQETAASPPSGKPGTVGDGAVLSYLTRFIAARPSLAQGSPVTLVAGNVPVALPPTPMVTGGLMLVGDAARQVDPLTGGGITNAMNAGTLAAQVAVEAIERGDTSARFLSRYEERWQGSIGRRMRRNYRLREKFPPSQRADERFVRAFALAVSG